METDTDMNMDMDMDMDMDIDMDMDKDNDKDKNMDKGMVMDINNYVEMPDLTISCCNMKTGKFKRTLKNFCKRLFNYLQYFLK
jgi:hypothetical protein